MLPNFQLSASLEGHSQDVRALCVPDSNLIISASRDTFTKVWERSKEGGWSLKRSLADPDGKFVSAVAWLVMGDKAYIACGSQSSKITLYDASTDSGPAYQLSGHKSNVCCLDTNSAGLMISGSWDKTAIVWNQSTPVLKFDKHIQAVWDVKCIGEDRFLTASADKTIQMFDLSGNVLAMFYGHTDCVRSLSIRTDGEGFWSAANDGNVMKWSFNKTKPIATLSGHSSFVYAVAALADGSGAVSSGEDGTVKVWKDDIAVQTITHPTISVWTVNVLPNGDIVSGASDSAVRIFSKDEDRVADQVIQEIWDKAVASRQINKTQVGDVKHTDLPGMEALSKPGKSEGQVIMIKNNGKVEAYQWQSSESTWQQVGEVVDAVGSGRKQLFKGIEYDYVFDVDIADGVPPLKLPFNANENPYAAAEKFLNRNELPLTYTEQVVKFIESNTAGVQLGGPTYQDPFTGASSYRPGQPGAAATGNTGGYRDPFTGSGAYRPGDAGASSSNTTYRDPFTGGGAYSTQQSSASASSGFKPIKTPQFYKQINVAAVKGKVAELNGALKADATTASLAFTPEEEATMSEIFAQLALPALAQPSAGSDGSAERWQAGRFLGAMKRWPEDKRFPLIDICRMLCATSPALASASSNEKVLDSLLQACSWDAEWEATKVRETNTLLAVRGLANLTATTTGKARWNGDKGAEVLDLLTTRHAFSKFNKNTRVAFATVALNLSVLAAENELSATVAQPLLRMIVNILSNEPEDGEVAYRALVALGNLTTSNTVSGSLAVGDVQLAKEIGSGIAERMGEQRLKTVVGGL